LAANVAGPDSIVSRMGRAYPPAMFAWQAMSEPASLGAVVSMLEMIAACALGPALVIILLSGAYAKSLVGFNESHLKKLSRAGSDALVARRIRAGRPFLTMVKREFDMMNREPMYLLNGPFIVVLMPFIVGVMLLTQKDVLMSDPDMAGVKALMDGGLGAVLASLVGAFLGSSTSIACTAVSRDAKALPFIKSLPVSPGSYMLAKLAHALIFGVIGSAIGVGLLAIALKLRPIDALAGLAVSASLSSLLNMAGLWLDTANPRLAWDNPIAAMKQNPNSVIAILGTMALLAGVGYLAFSASMGTGAFALWFGALPAIAFVALLALYPRFAEKMLAGMEG
jgi:ABC-2 type transport system permease protein